MIYSNTAFEGFLSQRFLPAVGGIPGTSCAALQKGYDACCGAVLCRLPFIQGGAIMLETPGALSLYFVSGIVAKSTFELAIGLIRSTCLISVSIALDR